MKTLAKVFRRAAMGLLFALHAFCLVTAMGLLWVNDWAEERLK